MRSFALNVKAVNARVIAPWMLTGRMELERDG
jgi:hypothetical protein